MLTAAALVSLVAWVALAVAAVGRLVDRLDRRRAERVAAQVRMTDAVHGALGAIVAPTVAMRRGRPWTVTMGLAPKDLGAAGRLTEIAGQALGQGEAGVRVVFVPRSGAGR
jgi:hypothetical protein